MADQGSTIRIKADEQRTTALTVRCPAWCVGHEDAPQYRTDISHVGPDEPLTLPTRRGPVTHLVTALEIRPYSDDPFVQSVFVNVGIGGDWYPTGLAGLEAMADQLEAHAEVLRDRARRLAVLLGGDQ
jgi:hypothetical protein